MFDWWAAFIYSQLLSRTIVFNMKCFFLSFSAKPFCQINFGFVYLWETDEASAKWWSIWQHLYGTDSWRLHSLDGSSHSEALQNSSTAWNLTNGWELKWPFQRRWCQFQLEVNHDIWYLVLQKEKRAMWTGQQCVHFPVNAWTESIHWLQCNLLWIIVA